MRLRVERFTPGGLAWRSERMTRRPAGHVRVRVTHASVGSTDALAASGGYLLHPVPGFTTGYDLVGVVVDAPASARFLRPGARVAAFLPGMGAHADYVDVPVGRLVPVPAGLTSAEAAVLPLDALTASLAVPPREHPDRVFVQGASGPVGSLVAQRALSAGALVVGSASGKNLGALAEAGVLGVDHSEHDWGARAVELAGGPFDLAVDHRGDPSVRRLVASSGIVVRTSFLGKPGRERRDTFVGALRATTRRAPRERVVSTPLTAAVRPRASARLLAEAFADAAAVRLRPSTALMIDPAEMLRDGRMRATPGDGRKLVIHFLD